MKLVIDASAILAVLMDEPERAALIAATEGAQLCAPASLPWEVGNALSAMFKKRRLALSKAQAVLQGFHSVPIRLVPVNLEASLELAETLRLYAYDAYMLETARAEGCGLLTLDRGLQQVARAAKVKLIEVEI